MYCVRICIVTHGRIATSCQLLFCSNIVPQNKASRGFHAASGSRPPAFQSKPKNDKQQAASTQPKPPNLLRYSPPLRTIPAYLKHTAACRQLTPARPAAFTSAVRFHPASEYSRMAAFCAKCEWSWTSAFGQQDQTMNVPSYM